MTATQATTPFSECMRWNCPICAESESYPVTVRADGFNVVQCASCGLVRVNPRPSDAELAQVYLHDYYRTDATRGVGYDGVAPPGSRAAHRFERRRIETVGRETPVAGKNLLEIGCGVGDFADLARRDGANVLATDTSPSIIELAASRYPSTHFHTASLDQLLSERRAFDVVCAFEVIEHVSDPIAFLKGLAALTDPNGTIILSTPNVNHALVHGVDRWILFKRSFEHILYFAPETLCIAAKEAGVIMARHYTAGVQIDHDDRGSTNLSPQAKALRLAVRKVLKTTRTLELSRSLRRSLYNTYPRYRVGGDGSSLLAVLKPSSVLSRGSA